MTPKSKPQVELGRIAQDDWKRLRGPEEKPLVLAVRRRPPYDHTDGDTLIESES